MGREEHCRQISLACVGSAHSVWPTLGLPQLMAAYAFLVYTAQAPGCSAGELFKAGPAFCAFPWSKLLRFRFSATPQRCRLIWACVLCPSQVRAAQATMCLASALSLGVVHLTSPFPATWFPGCAFRRAVCLFWGAALWLQPSRWMSCIQDPRKAWLSPRSLLAVWWRMPSLRLRLPLSFWLWLSPACLPASGRGWTGLQLASFPLVFAQSFIV